MNKKSIFKDGANKNLTHPRNKRGISLIVLVITIIVMIILAGAIIITLSNSKIISKASDAVKATDHTNMQELATMLWADAYLDGKRGNDLVAAVQDGLLFADKNYETKYDILITDSGVTVSLKEEGEKEEEKVTQLSKPTIIISENTLVIVDDATNGNNTAGFEIYVGDEKKATITSTTFDLTTLELEAGTYSITAKAIVPEDSAVLESELSEAVEYTVAQTVANTLGTLVTSAENYGDKVDYTVTVNKGTEKETIINSWRVFYKQTVQDETSGESQEYVYLIASELLAANAIPVKLADTVANGGAGATINGQAIYWKNGNQPTTPATIQHSTLWLANWNNYKSNTNGRCATYFLDETYWESFINETYEDYIVGVIGTPTAEMFVASWNAKREATKDTTKYNKKLSLEPGTTGYYVNDITTSDPATINTYQQYITTTDDLYICSPGTETGLWLASPSVNSKLQLIGVRAVDGGLVPYPYYSGGARVRPVICLKSNIPASVQGQGEEKVIVLDVD